VGWRHRTLTLDEPDAHGYTLMITQYTPRKFVGHMWRNERGWMEQRLASSEWGRRPGAARVASELCGSRRLLQSCAEFLYDEARKMALDIVRVRLATYCPELEGLRAACTESTFTLQGQPGGVVARTGRDLAWMGRMPWEEWSERAASGDLGERIAGCERVVEAAWAVLSLGVWVVRCYPYRKHLMSLLEWELAARLPG